MKLPPLAGLLAGCLAFAPGAFADSSVGQFAFHEDIGAPDIAGSTAYDASRQQYRMSAGGINLWGASDQFQFAAL